MFIDIKPRIRKPPIDSVQVDWGHPLAIGLVYCRLFGNGNLRDSVRALTATGTATSWATGQGGSGVQSGSTSFIQDDEPSTIIGVSASLNLLTYVALLSPTQQAAGVRYTVFAPNDEANALPMLEIGSGSGANAGRIVAIRPGTFQAETGDNTLLANNLYLIGYTRSGAGAGNQFLYRNGVSQALVTDSNATNDEGVASRKLFGARSTTPTQSFIGNLYLFYAWKRVLSPGDHLWLFSEPYAFLRPIPAMRYWSTPTAAAAAAGSKVSPRSFALLGVGS